MHQPASIVERGYWIMYQGERRTTPATLLYSLLVNGKLRKPWWYTQETWHTIPHTLLLCIPKMQNKYFQKWNCAALFPISTFLYLWAINIFPWSVHLFGCIAFAIWLWDFLKRSEILECWNWEWGRTFLFWGIFVSTFLDITFAVQTRRENIGSCITEKENNTCYSVIQLIGKWKT